MIRIEVKTMTICDRCKVENERVGEWRQAPPGWVNITINHRSGDGSSSRLFECDLCGDCAKVIEAEVSNPKLPLEKRKQNELY